MTLHRRSALFSLLFTTLILTTQACAPKNPVTAPVPGSINTFDAYAARVTGDAQAAIISAKTWEFCSDQAFPATVTFDAGVFPCDKSAGAFPPTGRPLLFKVEQSYNLAVSAGKAYHAGAGVPTDTVGLTSALTQLSLDLASMLSGVGKGK